MMIAIRKEQRRCLGNKNVNVRSILIGIKGPTTVKKAYTEYSKAFFLK